MDFLEEFFGSHFWYFFSIKNTKKKIKMNPSSRIM